MEEDQYTPLEYELLKTLSFMEKMSLEMIYLDLSSEFLAGHTDLTMEDLNHALEQLRKKKLIVKIKENKEIKWIKKYPQKNILLKALARLREYFSS